MRQNYRSKAVPRYASFNSLSNYLRRYIHHKANRITRVQIWDSACTDVVKHYQPVAQGEYAHFLYVIPRPDKPDFPEFGSNAGGMETTSLFRIHGRCKPQPVSKIEPPPFQQSAVLLQFRPSRALGVLCDGVQAANASQFLVGDSALAGGRSLHADCFPSQSIGAGITADTARFAVGYFAPELRRYRRLQYSNSATMIA